MLQALRRLEPLIRGQYLFDAGDRRVVVFDRAPRRDRLLHPRRSRGIVHAQLGHSVDLTLAAGTNMSAAAIHRPLKP
ncbi:hypothetical protein [Mycobacterium innocens]|uniref:hypothetical protein n=1 Tax=Mycobacterium innocens TaxID=2341083 RepID=UPI0010A9789C|nr:MULTISPECIES: hypothetical protein [Mycobacterium]